MEKLKSLRKTLVEHWKSDIVDVVCSKQSRVVFITAFLAAFCCYFEFLKNSHGTADWLNEGYLIYTNANWALSLGRWFLRFVNLATFNVVNPAFCIVVCTFLQAFSVILILRLWDIKSTVFTVLSTVAIVVSSAVTVQYLYVYTAVPYGVALLTATLSAYLILQHKEKYYIVISAILLALGLGCYQSYVGFAAGIIICTLILRLIKDNDAIQTLKTGGAALIMGVIGGSLYLLFWKFFKAYYSVSAASYGGASRIGLRNVLINLLSSVRNAYKDFFRYYFNTNCHRNIFFCIVLLMIVILIIALKNKITIKCGVVALLLFVPLAFNFVDIIATERNINVLMGHQMQLVIPFLFALIECSGFKQTIRKGLNYVSVLAVTAICIVFMVRAFATYKTVDLSYRYVETVAEPIVQHIISQSDYTSESRIAFIGYPDESRIQKANPLQNMSYFRQSAVFWYSMDCRVIWKQFILTTFGVDSGWISKQEYDAILDSEQFQGMACYPEEGAIQKIDDIWVVKFMDNPTR